ncbi:hypothetical protein [Dyella acidiphila]|uniref:Glycosyltransferase RgtA/B/C/D-like domain-containing protein n=1 Tax=Dyella acidiphila TaxID=2775866 RepID=A0ABR9GAQ6_9GAMM|nr:hypothetical protein [Dyella acidiphila]MBE1161117.1 hypothetical protein [Dyella acidiphila]
MERSAPGYRVFAWTMLAVLAAAGLLLTYRSVMATWFVDPDVVNVAMLRDGVARHGWAFLASWIYTTDNWVFSLLPWYWLLYATVGDTPFVLVVSGWVVFLLCAALTAYLVIRLTERRWVGAAVFALLVCPNYLAIGPAGLLGHPITHNSSMIWCLVGWLLAWRGLRVRRLGWMAGACVAALIVGLSDPWSMAAFILPALLSSLVLAVSAPRAQRRFFAAASALWLLTALLARTRVLHLLLFLPGYPLQRPDIHTLGQNAAWTLRSLGMAFAPWPSRDLENSSAILVGLVLVIVLLGWASLRLLAGWRALSGERSWMVLSFALSIAGTAAGAVIGPTPAGFSAMHFMINAYFLVPVIVASSACWSTSLSFARTAMAWGTVIAISGVLQMERSLQTIAQGDLSLVRTVKPLTELLQREHLTYGYGAYWGAQANAVTWYSRGRVVIRPIRFDPATGQVSTQHQQASRYWITPQDMPADQHDFFVILGNDGEICPDPAQCEAGVIRQWGPPQRRLTAPGPRGDLTILVWPKRLYSPGTLVSD